LKTGLKFANSELFVLESANFCTYEFTSTNVDSDHRWILFPAFTNTVMDKQRSIEL
jgi:hypothetical protein